MKLKKTSLFLILLFTLYPALSLQADDITVHGYTSPDFEAVKQTFLENFTERGDIGASCTVYYKGEKVVDIWGGHQAAGLKTPWEEYTRTAVYSATQGVVSMAYTLAWHLGFFDYDDKISKYWPEFNAEGREGTTVRQLLDMQSGIVVWPKGIKRKKFLEFMNEPGALESELLKITPMWEPGKYSGYSTDIQGHLCAVLFQKIDPKGRSIGTFIRQEMTDKLDNEFDLGLPETFPDKNYSKIKIIVPISGIFNLHKVSDNMKEVLGNPRSLFYKTMAAPTGYDPNNRECLEVEFAGVNGVTNARGLASVYNAFLIEDPRIFISPERSPSILYEEASVPEGGNIDRILNAPSYYHLGMQKSSPSFDFGSPAAFGFAGASGSFAYADPQTGIAYAYVTNKMDFYSVDPRDIALRETIDEILKALP